MTYAVAVDIGGTFTDLVAYDHETERVIYAKSPTTYENLVEGILDCLKKAQLRPDQATFVNHGTTLVINSLIQRSGAKTALLTSRGFRDILEIARGGTVPIPLTSIISATSRSLHANCGWRFASGWTAREGSSTPLMCLRSSSVPRNCSNSASSRWLFSL